MSAAPASDQGRPGHPSPHRDRVSDPWLVAAFAAGPFAWIVQLLISYVLAGYACYPQATLLHQPAPGWSIVSPVIVLVQVGALLLAALGTLLSWRYWRRTRHEAKGQGGAELLQAGEGRTRFIAVSGILLGAGFLVAILFDTIALIGVPLCRG